MPNKARTLPDEPPHNATVCPLFRTAGVRTEVKKKKEEERTPYTRAVYAEANAPMINLIRYLGSFQLAHYNVWVGKCVSPASKKGSA